MKEGKYKILIDYHMEGHSFYDEEFDTIDEAVKSATERSYGNPFLIVRIVQWEAKEIAPKG